jgi:Kef-type K+ transport system membrane component KefB
MLASWLLMLQGIFVGALLSMSSTSVVVKCLQSYRMNGTAFGQIIIGTLILQVCFGVGDDGMVLVRKLHCSPS